MSAAVRDWVVEQMSVPPFAADPEASSGPLQAREEPEAHEGPPDESAAAAAAKYWATAFNPGFWNNDPYVRSWNNCYNYAVNRRTNTFSQPGRASGYTAAMACNSVAQGASLDGARWWGNCFPRGTGGIWVMALVVAPGFDYHWYRYSAEGFWGHKPGGTAAKNTDIYGAIVYSLYYSARRPYTTSAGTASAPTECASREGDHVRTHRTSARAPPLWPMSYPAHSASLPRLIVRLFGGRPNPGLVLSEADVTEIRRILSKLPVTKAHAQPIADRPLGYSGMAILLGDGGEIDVFHEDVRVHPVIGPTQHFNDRESTLEQLLVAVARSRLAEPLPWNWITGRDSPSGS